MFRGLATLRGDRRVAARRLGPVRYTRPRVRSDYDSLGRCSSSAVIYRYAAREIAVFSAQSVIGMEELPKGVLRLGKTYSRRFWTENCVSCQRPSRQPEFKF